MKRIKEFLQSQKLNEGEDYIIIRNKVYLFTNLGNMKTIVVFLASLCENIHFEAAGIGGLLNKDAIVFEIDTHIMSQSE